MKELVLLSGEQVELAFGELKGVLSSLDVPAEPVLMDGRMVFFDREVPGEVVERMGFAHYLGKISYIEERNQGDVRSAIEAGLDAIDIDRSVSVKILSPEGRDEFTRSSIFGLFDEIARKRGFRVHHRDPEKKIFINIGSQISSGPIIRETNRDLTDERRGSKMPFNRPIVMEPKLARAMVNLSGLKPGSIILDPFMGPAGLVIEASHLGHEVIGIERDVGIHKGALENIEAQGAGSSVRPFLGDSRKMDELPWWGETDHIDGIVTDPPFGRSAPLMGENPTELIIEVMNMVSEKMMSNSPLVMDTDNPSNFEVLEDFRLKDLYSFRVHKSLTRSIGLMIKK